MQLFTAKEYSYKYNIIVLHLFLTVTATLTGIHYSYSMVYIVKGWYSQVFVLPKSQRTA